MFYTHQHRGQKIIFSFSRRPALAIQESYSDLVYLCVITEIIIIIIINKLFLNSIVCSIGNQNTHEENASNSHLLVPQEERNKCLCPRSIMGY